MKRSDIGPPLTRLRRIQSVRWLDLGADRFQPTEAARDISLTSEFIAADREVRRVPAPLDWVVMVIGLSDRRGTPLPDENSVERRFKALRAGQVERVEATFRYQEGLFGGYKERSLAIEVWPATGESIEDLADRMVEIAGLLLEETDQERAVMQTWIDGRLHSREDLVRDG